MKKICFLFIALAFFQGIHAQNKFTLEGNQLVLPLPIQFETASDKIKPESNEALMHIKAYLDEKTYITTLRIEGHTEHDGDPVQKQKLSERRALAVGRWLVAHGIDCSRLLCVGFGDTKPVADNLVPEGKAANRRITIINAGLRGRMIGGMPADGGGAVAGDVCK